MVNLNVFEFTLFDSLWQGDYCHNTVTTRHVTPLKTSTYANFSDIGMKIDISYDIYF